MAGCCAPDTVIKGNESGTSVKFASTGAGLVHDRAQKTPGGKAGRCGSSIFA